MPEPPTGRGDRRSERWAETNRPGVAWSRTRPQGLPVQLAKVAVRGSHTGRRPLTAVDRVDALTAGPEQGLAFVFWFEPATLPAAMKAPGGKRRRTTKPSGQMFGRHARLAENTVPGLLVATSHPSLMIW